MGVSDLEEEPEFSGTIEWGKFLDYLTYYCLKKGLIYHGVNLLGR